MTVACFPPRISGDYYPSWSPIEVGGDSHEPRPNTGGVPKLPPRLIRVDETVLSSFRLIHDRGATQARKEDSWLVEPDQRMTIRDLSGAMVFGAFFRKIRRWEGRRTFLHAQM